MKPLRGSDRDKPNFSFLPLASSSCFPRICLHLTSWGLPWTPAQNCFSGYRRFPACYRASSKRFAGCRALSNRIISKWSTTNMRRD